MSEFQAVYRSSAMYDEILPRHVFVGGTDTDLLARLMRDRYGPPGEAASLRVVEFGCGDGRVTRQLAPYAGQLVGVDSSLSMVDAFRARYPLAETLCLDTRAALTRMHGDGSAGSFDVVAAFWSLSYPLGDCFEQLSADGIRPVDDPVSARAEAGRLVQDLVGLLALDGRLLVLFFDSETREQRLVTRLWERVAAFPEGGRAYTRQVLVDELRAAEDRGEGWLTHTRLGGVAWLPSRQAARAWFTHGHLKDLPALVDDPQVIDAVDAFVDTCVQPSGEVALPSGVHLLDFHARREPYGLRP